MNKQTFKEEIEKALRAVITENDSPEGLYAPIRYGLAMGGKRLRPSLLLMTYKMLSPEGLLSAALPAAAAVEVFHNFTLLHDDLMDDAPLRRGEPTVYRKWDANTAILSGDAMLITAYRALEGLSADLLKPVLSEFNEMALGVCEGQQYDMEFEDRTDVSLDEYMEMIHFKTSCLIASSMKIGAIIARVPSDVCDKIYNVGDSLGLAFQLMDDYLDIWGTEDFGKRKGGDIIEDKKTWLLIKAFEVAAERQDARLLDVLSLKDEDEKVAQVTALYEEYGLDSQLLSLVERYTSMALTLLGQINVPEESKEGIAYIIRKLSDRSQ